LSEKIGLLKMQSVDGKFYLTDVADTEQLFRLIQSIPSPKAEPFKLWLAQMAKNIIQKKESGIPFLRVQNLSQTGVLEFDDCKYINEEIYNGMLKRSLVSAGDLLVKTVQFCTVYLILQS
jgi:hypothetical protein